jgi:hypothetical protein
MTKACRSFGDELRRSSSLQSPGALSSQSPS